MRSIYGLVDPRRPTELRYIGVTQHGAPLRLYNHVKVARLGDPRPVCQWIRELLADNVEPDVVILESGSWTEAEGFQQERVWIAQLRSTGLLLNVSDGGAGVRGELNGRRPSRERNGMHTHPEKRSAGDKHWTKTNPANLRRGDNHPMKAGKDMPGYRPKMSAGQARHIRALAAAGVSSFDIAARLNYSHRSVLRVIDCKTHKNA